MLFFIGIHIASAMDSEFDLFWRNNFPGRNLPQQEIKEKSKKIFFESKKFEDEARRAGIFIGDNYVKNKLDNEWRRNYYKYMEENWFFPFINSFSIETDKKEIQKRLREPESYSYQKVKIGTDKEEIEWALNLIAELNTSFNYPFVSLKSSIDESKIYATVIFKMQEDYLLRPNSYGRHISDHAALVLEYCDNNTWKSLMIHYHNAGTSGSGCGLSGKYAVSVRDKHGTYKSVLWSPNVNLSNHTHVDYFRYATFCFSRNNADDKLKVMEGGKACISPRKNGYSMRGIDGYENCCTYVSRVLEIFSGRLPQYGDPPLHWPEVPFKYEYKVFSPWFTANSLRDLIDGAKGKGKNDITLYNHSLSESLVDLYMTSSVKPQTMPSFPTKLYEQYWINKNSLLDVWNNRRIN